MSTDDVRSSFLRRCEQWLCDGYSCEVRYIATTNGAELTLVDASIRLNYLLLPVDNQLTLETGPVHAGQRQVVGLPKSDLIDTLTLALDGCVIIEGRKVSLPRSGQLGVHPRVMASNTWFQPLTCLVVGAQPALIPEGADLDTALRAGSPPFDGADDLTRWLGLRLPTSGHLSTISISIMPPVDLLFDQSGFVDDRLRLVLTSASAADRSRVGLAVAAVPSKGLENRVQVADKIQWRDESNGLIEGSVELHFPGATAALSLLLIGEDTVRRQWFVHTGRSPNNRYFAAAQFDPELRMVRQGLFENPDPRRFESAVAALLFVLGFSAAVQLETNSPDLVVSTPSGRLVLVECTTRIADVAAKIGKLVDRRGALQKALQASSQAVDVTAALVCRLPRDQIAAQTDQLRAMGILLASAEDLAAGLNRAQLTADADEILTQALLASSRAVA